MIVTHKFLFKNLNHKFKHEYYILDKFLNDYLNIINNIKIDNSDNQDNKCFGYFDVSGYLLVLEIKKVNFKIMKENREQIYYRIFNGSHVFWGENQDFEQII